VELRRRRVCAGRQSPARSISRSCSPPTKRAAFAVSYDASKRPAGASDRLGVGRLPNPDAGSKKKSMAPRYASTNLVSMRARRSVAVVHPDWFYCEVRTRQHCGRAESIAVQRQEPSRMHDNYFSLSLCFKSSEFLSLTTSTAIHSPATFIAPQGSRRWRPAVGSLPIPETGRCSWPVPAGSSEY
jgi:hypothetical protein